jgi:hypothetical protein
MCHILSSDGEILKPFIFALRIEATTAIREIIVCVCNCYLVTLSVANRCSVSGKLMNESGVLAESCLQATTEVRGGKHFPLSLFPLQIPSASVVTGRRLAARPSLQGFCM